jgi:hypothetical protein
VQKKQQSRNSKTKTEPPCALSLRSWGGVVLLNACLVVEPMADPFVVDETFKVLNAIACYFGVSHNGVEENILFQGY